MTQQNQDQTTQPENQQETAMPETKKVKKGLSLSSSTVSYLANKCKEVGRNQSEVADEVLAFALPAYQKEGGMSRLTIIFIEELSYLRSLQEPTVGPAIETDSPDAVPEPEPAPMKRGHLQKLQIPGQQLAGQGQPGPEVLIQPSPQAGMQADGLYRPGMGQGGVLPPQAVAQPEDQGFSQVELDYIVARLIAVQAVPQPQPAMQPGMQPGQVPVDMNVYNQTQMPQQPVQFAASYPPGWTGAPGVHPAAQQPQQNQGIYPYPGAEGQLHDRQRQRQPAYMNDPWAMNIANQVAQNQQPLTAQGLLSGSQNMAPNVAQPNINMEAARRALGPNWRQNLHSITGANRRG